MAYGKSIDFLLNQIRNYAGSLASGTITFYSAGTTSLKPVYLDREMTIQAANPYTLSADGTAKLFGSGVYRIVFKAYGGAPVYDYDDVAIGTDLTGTIATYTNADSPVDISVYSDITIIKTDGTGTVLNIIDTSGNTIMGIDGGDGINMTLENEALRFVLPNGATDWVVM